jgi:hypothetical protein
MHETVAPILNICILRLSPGIELLDVTFHPTFKDYIYTRVYSFVYLQSRTGITLCYFLFVRLCNGYVDAAVRIEVSLLVQLRDWKICSIFSKPSRYA